MLQCSKSKITKSKITKFITVTQIKVKKEGQIARITLFRPDKMNALTEQMIVEWRQVLEELKEDKDCRVIIVTGEGKAWSAGVDLSVFQRIKVEPGFDMHKDGCAIMDLLETMPQATIAMVNGYCFTGALELMLAFDMVICADEAKIGDTHAKWGIPPKWGMTQRLQQKVGILKAKEMSFTAQAVDGKTAEKIGLVNQSVPLADLEKTTLNLANQIIENSAQTIVAIKTLYHYGSMHTLKEGLDFEQKYEVELTDKQDVLKDFKKKI